MSGFKRSQFHQNVQGWLHEIDTAPPAYYASRFKTSFSGKVQSFREPEDRVARFARRLRLGIESGWGRWFGRCFIFSIYTYTYTHTLGKNQTDPTDFYILNSSYIGNVIIPTDELLLFRGVFPQAPTRWHHPMSHIYQPVHQHWLVGCDIGWSRGFCSTLDCAAVWFPQVRSNKEEQ